MTRPEPPVLQQRREWGALHLATGVITRYPSEAAYRNDPVWGRSEPVATICRIVDGHGRACSRWRRVYPKDRTALAGGPAAWVTD